MKKIFEKIQMTADETSAGVGEIQTELNYIRLFCDSTRELYEGCASTAEHKALSYIFKMIPYVNRQTNIFSYNQEEQAKDAIIFMPFSKFCTLVDYDATHAARLQKALLPVSWPLARNERSVPCCSKGGSHTLPQKQEREHRLLQSQKCGCFMLRTY